MAVGPHSDTPARGLRRACAGRPLARAGAGGLTNARRAFLLGSGGGFVLHLPVARNRRDRTLHDSKWFGASGFGRQYLSALRLWLVREGEEIALDRSNQTGFRQEEVGAVREYEVAGTRVRESLFVADGSEA